MVNAHRRSKLPWYQRSMIARLRGGMLCCALFACATQPIAAQEHLTSQWSMANTSVQLESTNSRQLVQMVVNTSREITARQPFKRVRIQNPNVITAIPLEGGNRLQINAIATGVTQVDLLGADESIHTIEVMVIGDVRELEAILRREFPDANLSVMPVQQGCIVSGYVTSDEHVNLVISIAELYFPTVINKVTVTGVHTVQLETQIMEISRTKLRELGIDWAIANGDDAVASTVGGILSASGTTFTGTGQETFQFGVIENGTAFFSAIRALRQNNLVKVLASPTLVAMDGRPASFNAGGEFPIVVPSGLGQLGIQYREFGTRLDYVAKVRDGGRIWLEVRPYVSEIDPSRSVTIGGISVPGLRSRYVETGVELGAGQTLAIAGLLQIRTETISRGLPLLADMPYLGNLFRYNTETQNEIELLITVTPNFSGPMNPNEVPVHAPGLNTDHPSDREFYGKGYIEVPGVSDCSECGPTGVEFIPAPGMSGTESTLLPPPETPVGSEAGSVSGYAGPNAPRLANHPEPPAIATENASTKGQMR